MHIQHVIRSSSHTWLDQISYPGYLFFDFNKLWNGPLFPHLPRYWHSSIRSLLICPNSGQAAQSLRYPPLLHLNKGVNRFVKIVLAEGFWPFSNQFLAYSISLSNSTKFEGASKTIKNHATFTPKSVSFFLSLAFDDWIRLTFSTLVTNNVTFVTMTHNISSIFWNFWLSTALMPLNSSRWFW